MNEIARIVQVLGGHKVLGTDITTFYDLVTRIR